MALDPHKRRFRLITLDASAVDEAALPSLERLLRAGVVVIAVDGQELEIRGPHRKNLLRPRDGAPAHPGSSAGPAPSVGRWITADVARPRGIRTREILAVGSPLGMDVAHVEPADLPRVLAAQAALCSVDMPGWIESGGEWHLVEEGYVPLREHELESLYALGNGYLGTRASLAEGSPLSSPATFVAGVYRRPNAGVPELLTLPDWARLAGTLEGEPLRIDEGEILSHQRVLDLRDGILWREWRHRDRAGRVSVVRGLRLASLADRHVLLQSVTLTPENYCGAVRVESVLSGTRVAHASTGVTVAIAIASVVETPEAFVHREPEAQAVRATERPVESLDLDVTWGETVRLDRIALVHTSRDHPRPIDSAPRHLARVLEEKGVEGMLAEHRRAWRAVWDEADVQIDGSPDDQLALRFAIYHLVAAVHPDDDAVSVGARGLSGKSYKGHVFWDTEIFMLPFYALTRPAAARSVLMYRHGTLPAARERARSLGYEGALYAWESADTGEDVTPPFVVAPTGELLPVLAGAQEHHISADVAYGVWLYWHVSGDDAFLLAAGAEILIETARFWASRAEEGDDGRWHLRQVIGPDEYHDSVDDDAYTNNMARWNLETAADLLDRGRACWPDSLGALAERLGLEDDEPARWRDVAARMYTGFDPETGLFEQFRGYFDLEHIDLAAYEPRELAIDLLLGPARIAGSQIIKQPDVLMLLWLLRDRFPAKVHEANFRFYEPRCAHGSSLSPPIHAALAARLGDTPLASRYLRQTAEIDLANNMGNAAGGVHMAALGGLWQAAVLGFAGLRLRDPPRLEPHLPPAWRAIRLGVRWRGAHLRLDSRAPEEVSS